MRSENKEANPDWSSSVRQDAEQNEGVKKEEEKKEMSCFIGGKASREGKKLEREGERRKGLVSVLPRIN